MNEGNKPICVERILVALDSSNHSFAALQAAVELAQHYDAILRGIFIEDINLLNLANMPFHREVGLYSAVIREITTDGISRGILVQSRWVVRTFHRLINRTGLQSEFAVLRGDVIETIRHEAEECDLLVMGKSGRALLKSGKLGSTARLLIQEHEQSLLLVEEGNQIDYPKMVLFDDSQIGRTALETSADLLGEDESLVVLLNEAYIDGIDKHQKFLKAWSSEKDIRISIKGYQPNLFLRFINEIRDVKIGLLILPVLQDFPKRRLVEICLEEVNLPILLIRT